MEPDIEKITAGCGFAIFAFLIFVAAFAILIVLSVLR